MPYHELFRGERQMSLDRVHDVSPEGLGMFFEWRSNVRERNLVNLHEDFHGLIDMFFEYFVVVQLI
jgi:hypothetical protein